MHKTIRGQTTGTFRAETIGNNEYIVIPVVAMIEGVRLGAAQTSGELGLASEFGKFPEGWNTKPVVMNHPKSGDNFVSAGQPKVLEEYQFGSIFNTHLSGKKLKMEAWLDKALATKNDTIARTFERAEAGEIIEVSVGFFTEVEEKDGTFNGQEYTGVWRSVMPDHLAFLEEGTIGACSVEDGCGTRVNSIGKNMAIKTDKGAKKKSKAKNMTTGVKAQCGCEDPKIPSVQEQEVIRGFIAQAVADELLSGDIINSLSDAIGELYTFSWVIGYTNAYVVFSAYDMSEWCTWQQTFDIDSSGAVTLSGEPQEVRLITKIVPAADAGDVTTQQSTEDKMPKETKVLTAEEIEAAKTAAADAAKVLADKLTPVADTAAKPAEAVVQASPAKALTPQEYIAQAPSEMREVLQASLNLHQKRKNDLITNIKATNRCQLGDDFLVAQSVETLEGLAQLAAVPQNYAGVAVPSARAQETDTVAKAPLVFERKTA